jgi:hypothetical protein
VGWNGFYQTGPAVQTLALRAQDPIVCRRGPLDGLSAAFFDWVLPLRNLLLSKHKI